MNNNLNDKSEEYMLGYMNAKEEDSETVKEYFRRFPSLAKVHVETLARIIKEI